MSITVFSKAGCGQCQYTKRMLKGEGLEFQEKRVDLEPEAMAYIKSLGVQSLPFVETENDSWTGLRIDKIKALKQ